MKIDKKKRSFTGTFSIGSDTFYLTYQIPTDKSYRFKTSQIQVKPVSGYLTIDEINHFYCEKFLKMKLPKTKPYLIQSVNMLCHRLYAVGILSIEDCRTIKTAFPKLFDKQFDSFTGSKTEGLDSYSNQMKNE